jgi:hypothetical protein
MLGVASSVPPRVLAATIPSVARSKNPRKTRAPSLFFLDRQTLGGKVSGRPDGKRLKRKTVNGPVSLTAVLGYRCTQVPSYWPKEANAYSLFSQLGPDPLPVPSDSAQNVNLICVLQMK